jgi:hypothetical protein
MDTLASSPLIKPHPRAKVLFCFKKLFALWFGKHPTVDEEVMGVVG